MDKPTCTIDGCAKKVHCKGLCPMHYQRLRIHGSLDKPPPRVRPQFPPCTTEGCESEGNRKGMCEKHYKREWHEANWDRTYAKAKARRNAKRDQYLADTRAYYAANRDRILARMAEAYAADPAKRKSTVRRWQRANRLRVREYELRRRARKMQTRVGPVDYVAILAEHGMFCHICSMVIVDRSDLHFDHVIPLAKGGTHTQDNIKPAHALCNIRKGARVA